MTDEEEYYMRLLKVASGIGTNFGPEDYRSELNRTETSLLNIVCSASLMGERIISTKIADTLGITRSAVSQIVDKLERKGYVQRVDSLTDKKIAYIELTEREMARFREKVAEDCNVFTVIKERIGEGAIREALNKIEGLLIEFEREKMKRSR